MIQDLVVGQRYWLRLSSFDSLTLYFCRHSMSSCGMLSMKFLSSLMELEPFSPLTLKFNNLKFIMN